MLEQVSDKNAQNMYNFKLYQSVFFTFQNNGCLILEILEMSDRGIMDGDPEEILSWKHVLLMQRIY